MNKGIKKEEEFAQYLNGKKYKELNDNLKCFIKFIYKDIDEDGLIKCEKLKTKDKTDVIINYNSISKNISLKSGKGVSIHVESIISFVAFLKNIRINENIINYYLKYHYGDDSLNGSGKVRFSAEEAKTRYEKEILVFNKYVNHNNIIIKAVNRFLFDGVTGDNRADYIYYGDINNGIWCSKNEIINYFVKNKSMDLIAPHFSGLTIQNWCRNIVYNKRMESHREYIQIKWFNIVDDITKIRK